MATLALCITYARTQITQAPPRTRSRQASIRAMRILHTSDWHLGRSLHGADLTDAFSHFVAWLEERIREEKIDVLLISGDLFDRPQPGAALVRLLSRALTRMSQLCEIIVISGNHDSAAQLGFCAPLMRGIHILTSLEDLTEPIILPEKDGAGGVIFYGVPYLAPRLVRKSLEEALCPENKEGVSEAGSEHADGEEPAGNENVNRTQESDETASVEATHHSVMDAAVTLIERDLTTRLADPANARENEGYARILLAHTFVRGAQRSDSEYSATLGGVDAVGTDVFSRVDHDGRPLFDYVALGHLHSPQVVQKAAPAITYAGSPVAYSFSERKAKSVWLLENNGREVTYSPLPIPTLRPLAQLSDSFDALISPAYANKREHYVAITVVDKGKVPHMRARLKEVFPYMLELSFQKEEESQPTRTKTASALRQGPPLIADFMESSSGWPLTQVQRALIEETWTLAQGE